MVPQSKSYFDRYRKACWAVSADVAQGRYPNPSLDERQEFYLELLAENGSLDPETRVVDLGGGVAWFIAVLAQMDLKAALVDDFGGGGGIATDKAQQDWGFLDAFRRLGVEIHSLDILKERLPFADESVDAVTCFHSLEHWHNSPKRLFAEIRRILRPSGYLILATPNAVNLRKRVYAVMGLNPFTTLDEWYEEEMFRGHVREPSIADLQTLLRWNEFRVVSTQGRNFIGQSSMALSFLPSGLVSLIAKVSDRVLRWVPSLCSDIHVVGQKRAN